MQYIYNIKINNIKINKILYFKKKLSPYLYFKFLFLLYISGVQISFRRFFSKIGHLL